MPNPIESGMNIDYDQDERSGGGDTENEKSPEEIEAEIEREAMEKVTDMFATPFLFRIFKGGESLPVLERQGIPNAGKFSRGYWYLPQGEQWSSVPLRDDSCSTWEIDEDSKKALGIDSERALINVPFNDHDNKDLTEKAAKIFLDSMATEAPELLELFKTGGEAKYGFSFARFAMAKIASYVLQKNKIEPVLEENEYGDVFDRSIDHLKEQGLDVQKDFYTQAKKFSEIISKALIQSGLWQDAQRRLKERKLDGERILIDPSVGWIVSPHQDSDYSFEALIPERIPRRYIRGLLHEKTKPSYWEKIPTKEEYAEGSEHGAIKNLIEPLSRLSSESRHRVLSQYGLIEEEIAYLEGNFIWDARVPNSKDPKLYTENYHKNKDKLSSDPRAREMLKRVYNQRYWNGETPTNSEESIIAKARALKVPIYDLDGSVQWPKQMTYEEAKAFVAERDKKKEQESTNTQAQESPAGNES